MTHPSTTIRHPRPGTTAPQAGTRHPRDELRRYLEMLAADERPGSLLEVRVRPAGQTSMRRWFIDVAARQRLLTVLPTIAQHGDVYLGVAPRRAPRGTRDAVTHAHVAWADVDAPHGAARLAAFAPAPSLVIASGSPGGAHGYWQLSRPADTGLLQLLNQHLATALGGDAVWAATSILRPPATRNHKHQPPRPVHVLKHRDRFYDPDALLASLSAITPNGPRTVTTESSPVPRRTGGDRLLRVAPRLYVERLLGVTVPRSGFISCPWHTDSTPSLKVYEIPDRGWRCYGRCDAGGSIYDLAARLWGCGTRGTEFTTLRARLLDVFREACG